MKKRYIRLAARWLGTVGAIIGLILSALVVGTPVANAVGNFNNGAIADRAETRPDGQWAGQCKRFVNDVVREASGGSMRLSGYQQGFANAGGVEVSSGAAVRGDVIQVTPAGSNDGTAESLNDPNNKSRQLHTAIVLTNNGNGNFWVIDSNSYQNPEKVKRHNYNPYSEAAGSIIKIWRLGILDVMPTQGSQNIIIRKGSTLLSKSGVNDSWTWLTDMAKSVKAVGNRIAMTTGDGRTLYAKDGVNGTWYQLTDNDVDEYAVSESLIVIRKGSTLFAKSGLNDSWTWLTNTAKNVTVVGNRIAMQSVTDNTLFVKDGINGGWTQLTSDAVDEYAVNGNLIVIRKGSTLQAKSGLNDSWTWLTNTAKNVKVIGNRITMLSVTDGTLFVKDGINGGWVQLTSDAVDEYDVSTSLIVIRKGSTLQAKSGLNDSWTWLTNAAKSVKVSGERVTMLSVTDNTLFVKDGINGGWTQLTSDAVDEYVLS